jgi:hypothetical protein
MWAHRTGKLTKVLLVANLCFWIYFAISFARASYPFKHDPWGHPTGAGYTFLGHSIGVLESPFAHPFYQAMFWVEFSSFAVARLGQNLLFPRVPGDQFFAGISEGGWRVLVVALLSFLQWYLVGWVGQKLWQRWSKNPGEGLNQAASSSPMPPAATTSRS